MDMATPSPLPTLDELHDQERRLVLPSLNENDAVAIGMTILGKAIERDLPVTIEVRRAGRVVFRAARNGTTAHNDMYVAGKARLVERFGCSTMLARLEAEADGTTFAARTSLAFPEYAPHGGGFPLIVEGTGCVGVAIVSGLAQQDDHALIVECLAEHLAARAR
jgi:uncharacterized protein (UPF0303 family)